MTIQPNLNIPTTSLPRIVVIGAGFGGLHFVKRINTKHAQLVLIDKNNYHTFQPLLYQVATAGLEPDSIAHAVRTIFHKKQNFHFRYAEVLKINAESKSIDTNLGELSFDYLVIATGSSTNYFGNKNLEQNTIPMKSIPEALNLRSILLQNFEAALLTNDLEERQRLMNFVIVGGGATGVELAGALAELKNHILPYDYPELDVRRMNVHLVQSNDKLLNGMSEKSSQKAKEYLQKEGVQLWFNTRVLDYDGKLVDTDNIDLQANTMIWAAGVKGTIINGFTEEQTQGNRYVIDEFCRVKNTENIFAIGDVASFYNEKYPKGLPMMAQPAIQQGKHLAMNFKKLLSQKPMIPFQFIDKGSMATIGRNKAVVDLPNFHFNGLFAWLVWMFVHLISLVGFRNKVIALANWVIQYFSYNKNVRLIIRPYKKL